MSAISKPERATQERVLALLRDELGWRPLGNWADRSGNSHIEEALLTQHLQASGYSAAQIGMALHRLRTEARHPNRSLYANNQAVYGLLRYGVPVQAGPGQTHETVHLVNWGQLEKNDFAFAEEVTLKG